MNVTGRKAWMTTVLISSSATLEIAGDGICVVLGESSNSDCTILSTNRAFSIEAPHNAHFLPTGGFGSLGMPHKK